MQSHVGHINSKKEVSTSKGKNFLFPNSLFAFIILTNYPKFFNMPVHSASNNNLILLQYVWLQDTNNPTTDTNYAPYIPSKM